jgi:peptide/nickel transport system permease protein
MDVLLSPSAKYILGTDHLGRDILSNIIYGARISVIIGLSVSAGSAVISTTIGAISAIIGGKFDLIVQRFVDGWMCIPGLLLLLTLMSIVGRGMTQIIVVLAFQMGIGGSRVIRSAVISIKQNVFVEAAQATGCSRQRLILRHILPNVMAPIITSFTLSIGSAILMESSLSFLGFGVPPGVPSWGSMLSAEGRSFMEMAPMLAIWPGLALSLTVYGANMFGDAMRDLLDPKLRGGLGRYRGTKVKKLQSVLKSSQTNKMTS